MNQSILSDSRRMTCAVRQLSSKQDSVFIGTHIATHVDGDTEDFDWMISADGHGSNYIGSRRLPDYTFQNQFDALDKDELVLAKDPLKYIDEKIKYKSYKCNVGSTLQIVRIYNPVDGQIRVEYFGIGDSSMRIFENDKFVAMNTPHKIDLPKEQARLSRKLNDYDCEIHKGHTLFVKSKDAISMMPSSTIMFYHTMDFGLSMSQSAGHHGITGYDPELQTLYFPVESKLQIIIGSDGLFDVMNQEIEKDYDILCNSQTAEEIVDFAEARWKQDWYYVDYVTGERVELRAIKLPDYDDVSACVFSRR